MESLHEQISALALARLLPAFLHGWQLAQQWEQVVMRVSAFPHSNVPLSLWQTIV